MDAPFSAATRSASLDALAGELVDVLVIGGGVTGTGIARDAALRGFRTALVERGDFAAGTSGRSSRLVHGGLRYLEHGAFHLVHESCRERRILLRIAPHLVRPRSFLFPLFAGGRVPRWQLAAGMWLYDALAAFRNVKRHRWLSKRELLRAEPGLRSDDLLGGPRYYDAVCDDARLALANARDAHRHGALVANYAEVLGTEIAGGRVRGARIRDVLTGTDLVARAHVTVNATGPWSDATRADGQRLLTLTKGAHVVVPRRRLGPVEAVTFLSPVDGRVMFIVPWDEVTYVGTTETDFVAPPADATASAEDVVYLLRSANAVFPDARLQPADVIASWAGVRPLVRSDHTARPATLSREHLITERPGLVAVLGGKLTTYRAMAAAVVDRVAEALHALDGRAVPPRAPTDVQPLPGGEAADLQLVVSEVEREGLAAPIARHLAFRYGTEAPAVARLARADDRLARSITAGSSSIRAELVHAARRELALSLGDLLIRRTGVFFEAPGHAATEALELATLVAPELGWDSARARRHAALYRAEVEWNEAFRSGGSRYSGWRSAGPV